MNWTTANIPSQENKLVIVTGASSGIGLETTRALASKGADIIMAVRNVAKGERVADMIRAELSEAKLRVMLLELGSMASIKAFSDAFHTNFSQLHLLINNAGLGTNEDIKTEEGFGLTMGVNHLGHFALTGYLLGVLLDTPQSRVVTVSSQAHRGVSINIDTFHTETKNMYGPSKLANILFALELQRRLEMQNADSISLVAHPGVARTEGVQRMIQSQSNAVLRSVFNFAAGLVMQTSERGALPILYAATDSRAKGGEYYGPNGFMGMRGYPQVAQMSKSATDGDLAKQLWERSVRLTGVRYEG